VDNRSSTSNSSASTSQRRGREAQPSSLGAPSERSWTGRRPLAGVLAVLALLVADAFLLGDRMPWARLAERIPITRSVEAGVARDRSALAELRSAAADRIRVAVVGSSRVVAGFLPALATRQLPEATFVKLAHPGVEPFVIRALVEELRIAGVDAVVLALSELDTHRPLRLEPIPGPGSASVGFAALPDLLAATGPGFALRNRESLYRLTVAAVLRGYRYRGVLEAAGLAAPLTFATNERVAAARPELRALPRAAIGDTRPGRVSAKGRQRVQAELAKISPIMLPAAMVEVDIVSEIGNGPHVAVQMALLRRSVARLRDAGVAVLLVEVPLNPVTVELYDVRLRRAFLAFATELAEAPDVWFAPLERFEPFDQTDFLDLLHTTPRGAAKLTRGITKVLRSIGLRRAESS